MPEKIKGITVEIGGDTTPLGKAIDGINKKSKALQTELRGVNTLLKGDPKSTVLQSQKQELLGKSVEETRKKLELLKSKQAEVTAAFEKYSLVSPKIEELKSKISSTSEELKELKLKQDEAKAAFDKGEISEQQYKEIENQVKETKEALTSLKAEQNELSKGTINAEQYRDFQREIVKTETDLKSLQAEQKKANALKFDSVIKSTQTLGNNIVSVGNKLKTVSTISAGILALSVKNASQYETAVAKASTLTDKTVLSNEKLSSGMLKISSDLNMANTDIAEATYQALSASVETGNALEFTAAAAKLAKAGFTETATSVDVLTTIQNAYNLSADKTNQLADMLVNTQNKGKTTVGQLAESMGRVIPTAETLNVSIGQLCTGYAEMTKRGINTANATTYMNSLFDEFGKSSTQLYKITKEATGKTFKELMTEGKSLGDVLGSLSEYAKKNNKNFNDFFGKSNSRKAALSLLKVGADGFNSSLRDMENCTGIVDQALEDLQTPTSKAKKALNNLKNTSVEFGSQLLGDAEPIIEDFGEKIKSLSDWWGGLNETQKESVGKIAAIVAIGSPALTLIGKTTTGISQYVSGLKSAILSITAKTTVTAADTVATTGATVATGALGVAMKALPLIGVASLIIGVVSSLASYALSTSEAEKNTSNLSKSEQELIKTSAEAKKSYDEMKVSTQKQAQAEIANIEYTQRLAIELESLVDENGKVKASYEARAEFILGELNKALGTEYKNISDVIGANGKLKNSIYDVINAKKAKILLEAHEQSYSEAIKNVADAETAQAKAARDAAKQQEIYNAKYKEYQEARMALDKKAADVKSEADGRALAAEAQRVNSLKVAAEAEKNSLEKKKKILKNAASAVNGYYKDINEYETASTLVTKGETTKAVKYLNNLSSGFKTVESTANLSAKKQKQTLKQQVIDTEVNARLMKEKYKNGVTGVTKEMVKTAQEQAAKAKQEFVKIGGNITDGITQGAEDGEWKLIGAMEKMARDAYNAVKEFFDINSPSGLMRYDIGVFLPEGTALGVADGTPKLLSAIEKQNIAVYEKYGSMKKKARAIMSAFTSDVPEEYNTINLGANFHSAVEHTFSNKVQTQSTLTALSNLSNKIDELIDKIPTDIYLDGQTLVGGTVSKTDRALGTRQIYASRGLPST